MNIGDKIDDHKERCFTVSKLKILKREQKENIILNGVDTNSKILYYADIFEDKYTEINKINLNDHVEIVEID